MDYQKIEQKLHRLELKMKKSLEEHNNNPPLWETLAEVSHMRQKLNRQLSTTRTNLNLKTMLIKALEQKDETLDDIIATSIPLDLMDKMSTLEEIQCYYLHSHPDKQGLPLVAFTKNYVYFHNNDMDVTFVEEYCERDRYPSFDYVPGVEAFPLKDYKPYNESTIAYMKNLKEKDML